MTLPAALTDAVGTWAGTNGFRLMPSDPLHDAPATAEVSTAAGGNLVAIAYTWAHPADGPQDGLLVLGAADDEGAATAFWADSWHQSPAPQLLGGAIDGDVVTISYEYGEGWQWHVTVDATDPQALRLGMDNVTPDTPAYPVMVATLRREPID